MNGRKIRTVEAIAGALLLAVAWASGGAAEPQRLDCVLTDAEGRPGSENRPLVVLFDESAKTLTAKEGTKEGDHSYSFGKISISNVAISGLGDDISIGIDRSSLGIVWQQYEAGKVRTEYGHCRRGSAPK
ncbi:MAG TPA: hypothetical protein VEK75_09935 [Xanthobacteraceae bacterium]|nr:hypothetical protein [Xanthobacteraceae bacterium]